MALIDSYRRRGYNGHLGLVPMSTQYALVIQVPFVHPTNPSQMPTILALTAPFDKKNIVQEHVSQRQQYDECRNIDATLSNQILPAFEYTYLSPPQARVYKILQKGNSPPTRPSLWTLCQDISHGPCGKWQEY